MSDASTIRASTPRPPSRWRGLLAGRLTRQLCVPLLLGLFALSGCKGNKRGRARDQLIPPDDAPAWESRFDLAFDDAYAATSINLKGRASYDSVDQELFQTRLGHATLIILVRVEQVWTATADAGIQEQFLELDVGEVLLGHLPRNVKNLTLEISNTEKLEGETQGQIMLLFVRWDPGASPPYHHHLMPSWGHGKIPGAEGDDLVAMILAMVEHARSEGVLKPNGVEIKRKAKKKKAKKTAKNPPE